MTHDGGEEKEEEEDEDKRNYYYNRRSMEGGETKGNCKGQLTLLFLNYLLKFPNLNVYILLLQLVFA